MKKLMSLLTAFICSGLLLFGTAHNAYCGQNDVDSFPERPITIINPFAPGGSSDLQARIIAEVMQKNLGQTINVVSKKGGAGAVGMNHVKNARPDGYTIILTCLGPCGLTPNRADVGYVTPEDFRGIAQVSLFNFAVAVHKDSGINSFDELLAYSRKNPGESTYGTCGAGLFQHVLFSDFLNRMPDTGMEHIPFNGGAEATSALLGKHVLATVQTASEYLPHYKAGTIKLLAITGPQRLAEYPDVPTFKELGYETLGDGTWFGFAAPKKTPDSIIMKLQSAVKDALNDPVVQERYTKAGLHYHYEDGKALDEKISREYEQLGSILKDLSL